MPKHDDAPEPVICDGCARQGFVDGPNSYGGNLAVEQVGDLMLCPDCARRQSDDPPITIHGRTLLLSEMTAQAALGDKDLRAALTGDTVQDQIKAAKKR